MTQYTGDRPKFIEFITPVGRVWKCYIDRPQLKTDMSGRKVLDDNGIQVAEKQLGLMWPKHELNTTLIPMRTLAAQARDQKWAPGTYDPNFFAMEPFLRDGDNPQHNTKGRADLRGHVYMTFKKRLTPQRMADGQIAYTGDVGILGPYQEDILMTDVYAGCWGRASGILFGTEHSGRRFISVRLNNFQKGGGADGLGNGERLAAGPPSARSQFDPLIQGAPPTGAQFGGGGAPQGFPQQPGGSLCPTGPVDPFTGQPLTPQGQAYQQFAQQQYAPPPPQYPANNQYGAQAPYQPPGYPQGPQSPGGRSIL